MTTTKFSSPPSNIPPGHVRVGAFHAVPGLIRNLGGHVETVLAPLRLSEKFLARPDNVLPIATLGELLHRAACATACEHFGLLAGSHGGVGQIGAPGQLMLRFPTVGAALGAMQRFFHLHNRAAIVVLCRAGNHAHFGYSLLNANFYGFQELQDGAMAVALNIMQRILGDAWRPTEVNLVRREPRRPDIYSRFFGAPCVFNAVRSTLVFPVTTLDLPVLQPDSASVHGHPAAIPSTTEMDLVEQIRRTALGLLLSGKCSQQTVAAALGYSTRTLNRKLALVGSSYREISDYSALCGAQHKADYVDASIMLNRDRHRAPTARLERQAPISDST